MRAILLIVAMALALPQPAKAESTEAAVAKILRDLIVRKVPTPALDTRQNWGHQKDCIVGYDVKRHGTLDWVSSPITEKRNDGHWTRLVVTLREPAKTLSLSIDDMRPESDGTLQFRATLSAADVHLKFEQQFWKRGLRVFSNETRATCRAAVRLDCSLSRRVEMRPGAGLPTMVLRLQVAKADLSYDHLVVQHTLGMGGDAARIIGDTTRKLIAQIKPDLERDLIRQANAAIVKATNDKEVRLSLENLMKK